MLRIAFQISILSGRTSAELPSAPAGMTGDPLARFAYVAHPEVSVNATRPASTMIVLFIVPPSWLNRQGFAVLRTVCGAPVRRSPLLDVPIVVMMSLVFSPNIAL
jgi:hypothetical protein